MTHDYAEYLLRQWGLWCLSGRTDLGYPHQAAFLNGQPVPATNTLAIQDETAMKVQKALIELDRAHRRTAEMRYVKMRSVRNEDIARYLGCSVRTLQNRVERIRVAVTRLMD
jgi:DNA-directed RNA polymerase specialized sigma24 family protein